MSDDKDDLSMEPQTPNELLDELGSIKALLDEELESEAHYNSISEISSVEEYVRIKHKALEAGISIEQYLEQQAAAAESASHDAVEEEIPLLDDVFEAEDSIQSAAESSTPTPAPTPEESIPTTAKATTVEEYFAAVAAAKRSVRQEHAEPAAPAVPRPVEPPAESLEIEPALEREESAVVEEATPLLDEVADDDIPLLEEVAVVDEAIPLLEDTAAADDTIPTLNEVASPYDDIPVLDEIVPEDSATPLLDEFSASESVNEELSLEEMQDLVDLIVNRKLERLKPELEREVMGELQKLLPLSALTKS